MVFLRWSSSGVDTPPAARASPTAARGRCTFVDEPRARPRGLLGAALIVGGAAGAAWVLAALFGTRRGVDLLAIGAATWLALTARDVLERGWRREDATELAVAGALAGCAVALAFTDEAPVATLAGALLLALAALFEGKSSKDEEPAPSLEPARASEAELADEHRRAEALRLSLRL
jgi:hypothetical protein